MVTAVSTTALWRRQKRQPTIEAWTSWSDNTLDLRKLLTQHLGPNSISSTQARALVLKDAPLLDKEGQALGQEIRADIGDSLAVLLNGLERLAVGVRVNVYDAPTLQDLGATIIVRTWERFEPYVQERRTTEDRRYRQERAFIALEAEVARIEKHRVLDRARVAALSRVGPSRA
jgi:hypothetical protein